MKKTALHFGFLLFVLVVAVTGLFSCGDKTGRRELRKTMLSDFTSEIDYLIELEEKPVSGSAVITKNQRLRLDILSPDPYSGISVECDVTGEAEVVSISYSGIKAEVPGKAMEKLVFLMNMMSESTASALGNQNAKDYKECGEYLSEDYKEAKPYEVCFTHDGAEYVFIYDSVTGMPLEIFADNGYCKAEIKVRKLKTEETVSEE